LTKLHEEVVRGTASQVLEGLADIVKGEVVVVLEASSGGSPRATGAEPEVIQKVLEELLRSGVGVKRAAGVVSTLTGMSQRDLYRSALEIKRAFVE